MTRAKELQDDRVRLMRGVHAACRKLGLNDDARHEVQLRVTGKASMRDMTPRDLARLLDHFNRQQGRSTRQSRPLAPRGDLRLIHALWSELGRRGALDRPGRAGLNAFIRARFGMHWGHVPIDIDALTDTAQITDVIQALRAMLDRTAAPQAGSSGAAS